MTKLLTLILLALVAMNYGAVAQTADDAPIIFPDSLFKARLLDESRHSIDTNKDGEISIAEARNYTDNIDVSGAYTEIGSTVSIRDLTGIEHFTNIIYLDCSNNSLRSLDLSHNEKLESLLCVGNFLTSLDLSYNKELKGLLCFSNSLTSLDVSKNTKLEKLECFGNSLTSLDLHQHLSLEILNCFDNSLTTLDVSKNAKLKELYCKPEFD